MRLVALAVLLRAARALIALIACGAALACAGCEGTHLAGTHDVELEYEVRKSGDLVALAARAPIEGRLGAAHLPADVEPRPDGHVHVTVDRDAAESADEMLLWRGGLAVYAIAHDYAYAPRDPAGLASKMELGPDGAPERYFAGPRERVAHAAKAGDADATHAVLIEPEAGGGARTRVVTSPAAVELREVVDFDTGTASDGRALVLYVRDVPKLRAAIDALAGRGTVVALGRSVLSRAPLGDLFAPAYGPSGRPALVLPMGDDITAYSRAHQLRTLLRSGVLPPLARIGEARVVPARWPVALGGLALPMLLSFAWLFFVRRFDRAYPEPWWLVLATFALGGLSVVPAGFAEWAAMTATPYLNPSVMTLGGQVRALPIALAVFTVTVGLSEEGSKLFAAWVLAGRRPELDEPVDGIIYGAAASLGFAAVENIKYFAFGRMGSALIVARAFTSIPAHLFFGAIWGYALGKRLVSRRTRVLVFLGWAALMHGAFDTLLSLDGMAFFALALNLALASLFIWLLRRALRHGVALPGRAEAPPSTSRALYPVGRPGLFALAALGLHLAAAALFVLGAGHQALHQRVTYTFVAVSSVLAAALGACAYALAATMPLDVAVDENGVTFAGRAVPWLSIRAVDVADHDGERATVLLAWTGGVSRLGPGRKDRMQALAHMIRAALDARDPAKAT